jgi:hypothetical protein
MPGSATMRVPGKDDFIDVHGMMVEKKAHHIVERIKDFDDNLEVLCVQPGMADVFEAPFMLIEKRDTPDGPRAFKVFDFWELNESVLERLHMADSSQQDILDLIDKENERVRKAAISAHRDKMESKKDLVKHIVADTKTKYSYFDDDRQAKVTIFEDGRLPLVEHKGT